MPTRTLKTSYFACAYLCLALSVRPGVTAGEPVLGRPEAGPAGPSAASETARRATSEGGLTADEAIKLALLHNPHLTAAARELRAARVGVRSARALSNPSVLITPAILRGGSDEEILAQQPLELNGSRAARAGVAGAELRRIQAEGIVQLRTLVFDTRSAYYELTRAQELESAAQEGLQTAEEFDTITRRLVDEGLRPGVDRIQTGIEVTRARQQVTLAQARVRAVAAGLNTLMGRLPTAPVIAVTPISVGLESVDPVLLTERALAARAEIAAGEAQRDGFHQQARLVRSEGRPDLVAQFRMERVTRGTSEPGVAVGISLPILDYGSRRNRARQADESARAQEARIAATRNQVRQEVAQAVARLQAAALVIRDYQSGVIEQSRRLLEASRTAFQAGQYGVLQVLEARRTYRDVQSDYVNALAEYALANAELERATGSVPASLFPESGVPADPETPSRSTR